MNVRTVSIALTELVEAMEWYERKQTGLGNDLLTDYDRTAARIREYPYAVPVILNHARRFPLSRFPYAVWYAIDGDTVVVEAVVHQNRDPKYLIERMD